MQIVFSPFLASLLMLFNAPNAFLSSETPWKSSILFHMYPSIFFKYELLEPQFYGNERIVYLYIDTRHFMYDRYKWNDRPSLLFQEKQHPVIN